MTSSSPVPTRTVPRRSRCVLVGALAVAGLGAVAGAGIAGADSINGPNAAANSTPVTECTVTAKPVDKTTVAVLLSKDELPDEKVTGSGDTEGKTTPTVADDSGGRVAKLKTLIESHYKHVDFYLFDGHGESSTLKRVTFEGDVPKVASGAAIEPTALDADVTVNYAAAASSSIFGIEPEKEVWISDASSRSKFDLSTEGPNDADADPAMATASDLAPGSVQFTAEADRSGELTVESMATSLSMAGGSAHVSERIRELGVPVVLSDGEVKIGDRKCDPSDGEALVLPATVSWEGGSGTAVLTVAGSQNGPNLAAPAIEVGREPAVPPETTTPEGLTKRKRDVIPPSDSRGVSLGAIAGGGLVGLLVGAGAGVALMGARRRNEQVGGVGGMRGFAVAGGHPYPYGTGAAPAAAADTQGFPIVSTTVPPTGAAAVGLAKSKRGDQRPREWTVAAPGGTAVRLDDIGATRLMPRVTDQGRVWAMGRPDVAGTAGWFEKRTGKGEDAEPTMRVHAGGRGIIGVYDGTGGAGATIARTAGDGTELSGAWLASRLVRDVVEAWFVDAVADGDRALETAGLAATLHQVLTDEADHLPPSRSNIRGSLHRVLPTTAACVAFDADVGTANGTVDALWAGDSRAYVLTPGDGLQVLTRDDTREDDALELIRNDQPMENLIAADRPFRVNHRRYNLDRPIVLVTATDGAFGYVRTPAHFEYLLLQALATADSMSEWSTRLLGAFAEFAADDVSFAMAAVGFDSFADLKAQFGPRHEYLATEHWKPFVDSAGDAGAIERLREESWSVYKDLYMAKLAGSGVAVPADQRPAGQ